MPDLYIVECPECNCKMQVKLSIFQSVLGVYEYKKMTCKRCGILLNMPYDPASDTMTAELFSDFIDRVKLRVVERDGELLEELK